MKKEKDKTKEQESNAIVEIVEGNPEIVKFEKAAMTKEDIVAQVALIKEVQKAVMVEGIHYGKIPGTPKPTLLQPGAQKLGVTFRLAPDFKVLHSIERKDYVSFTIKCDLKHIISGSYVGSGVGSCNSEETGIGYLWEYTKRSVPKSYWDKREGLASNEAVYKDKDGRYYIKVRKKVENCLPLINNIVKRACKRAYVYAILNSTAASDIYTQDLEEMPPEVLHEIIMENQRHEQINEKKIEQQNNAQKEQQENKPKKRGRPSKKQEVEKPKENDAFKKMLAGFKKLKENGKVTEEIYYKTLELFGYRHTNEIKRIDEGRMIYKLMLEYMNLEDIAVKYQNKDGDLRRFWDIVEGEGIEDLMKVKDVNKLKPVLKILNERL